MSSEVHRRYRASARIRPIRKLLLRRAAVVATACLAGSLGLVPQPALVGSAHAPHAHVEIEPREVWEAQSDPIQARLGRRQTGPGSTYRAGAGAARRSSARGELFGVGVLAAEPTMGITSNGTMYFKGLHADAPGGYEWPVMASTDQGRTWHDVSPTVGPQPAHPYGQDPILYVDEDTDRIFNNDFLYPCSELSFQDPGDESWTQSAVCGLADHQNIFSGPPATSDTGDYPNVTYYCAIDAGATANYSRATGCTKSVDGGVSWSRTGDPAFHSDPSHPGPGSFGIPGLCDGATGHGFVDDRGTVYLPRGYCGQPWLAISTDEGASWTRVQVADNGMPATADHEVQEHEAGVVADGRGNVYYFYTAANRLPYLVVSRDEGKTWGRPVPVGPPDLTEASLPTLDISDGGALAMAYVGSTDAPGGRNPDGEGPEYVGSRWHGYLTVTTNPLARAPKLTTVTINPPRDPLQFHSCPILRCGKQYDFIDVVISPKGIPWMTAVDACTRDEDCVPLGQGVVGRMVGGPRLR